MATNGILKRSFTLFFTRNPLIFVFMHIRKLFVLFLLTGSAVVDLSASAKPIDYPESPDAAVRYVTGQLAQMNGEVLWDALPKSYRVDIIDLVRRASEKVDAENYNRSNKLLAQIAVVLESKEEFIRDTKIGGGLPEESRVDLMAALPILSGLLRDLSTGAIAKHEGLREFDGRRFCNESLSGLLRFLDAASELSGEEFSIAGLLDLEVKVLKKNEASATLEIVVPGNEPEQENFILIEGRWLPGSITQVWTQGIANARESIEAITAEQVEKNRVQSAMALGIFEGILSQIESAQTQEAFDLALQSAAMPLMGLFMMGGQAGFGIPSVPDTTNPPEALLPKEVPAK